MNLDLLLYVKACDLFVVGILTVKLQSLFSVGIINVDVSTNNFFVVVCQCGLYMLRFQRKIKTKLCYDVFLFVSGCDSLTLMKSNLYFLIKW